MINEIRTVSYPSLPQIPLMCVPITLGERRKKAESRSSLTLSLQACNPLGRRGSKRPICSTPNGIEPTPSVKIAVLVTTTVTTNNNNSSNLPFPQASSE